MDYDFDSVVNRRGTACMKWDEMNSSLPMWVADMDFQTAPEVRQALAKRVEHGVFGYAIIPDSWYDAYISWWRRRHQFVMEKDWLIFCTGIVPAISSMVRKLTTPNENVVLMTPVYNIFFNSTLNNGCRVLESPLQFEDGKYQIDFKDLEEKLANPQTTLLILCNPHNPVGVIWEKDELSRIGELCKQYNVTVISDEIHCDLTKPGREYTPFASVSETCKQISVTCLSPTKAFNLAGLQTAAVCVPNPVLRHKVWRGLNTDEVAEPNAFAVVATETAFKEGEPWLVQLREYLFENRKIAKEFIQEYIPNIQLIEAEATYLLWLDCREICHSSEKLVDSINEETGLYLCPGIEYGQAGEGFLRMNIACPRSLLMEGLDRLAKAVQGF